jgi:DNA-binding transcriptional ArsR family regulator
MIETEKTLEMPPADAVELPAVLAALSDPVRLAIVRELARRGEVPCGTLDLQVSASTRSHHLRTLREAGVTVTRVEGQRRLVSLRRDVVDARFPGLLDAVLASVPR